jgi:class 3 adenylate cyclase
MTGEGSRPSVLAERNEYSRARPDRDGVLRRIAPVLTGVMEMDGNLEHIIYAALVSGGLNRENPEIPLDRGGAVLFEQPYGDGFRRISIADFLAYDEADRELRRLLNEGDALGIFQDIEGENNPLFIYDYALSLREEISASMPGDEERKLFWIETRRNYFSSLENFLSGPAEMILVEGYDDIISSMDDTGTETIIAIRDKLVQTFDVLRGRYVDVLSLRRKLESALADSFCILGRVSVKPEPVAKSPQSILSDFPRSIGRSIESALYRPNPTDAEASALLANSIITGRAVKLVEERFLLWGSLISALLVCLIIKSLGPVLSLGTGALLTLLVGAGFSLSFIFSGLWLDPIAPAAACAAVVFASFIWALAAKGRYIRRFRLSFGPFTSRQCVRSLIRAETPLPSKPVIVRAAVVAVKTTDSTVAAGDTLGLRVSAKTVLGFQEKVTEIFKKAGGTVIGTESDMITVCFGSPLERIFLRGKKKESPYEGNINGNATPAWRAVEIVSELAGRPEYESWHFGIDLGDCSFNWTAISGYFALGLPVQRARVLSRLVERYKARILVSVSVNEALPDFALKKLDTLKNKDGSGAEPFYILKP